MAEGEVAITTRNARAEMGAEGWAMQQAFIYILQPFVTAKDASELAVGIKRVADFINCDSSFDGEYFMGVHP